MPSPPLIHGQITEISPSVCVTSLSPNATIIIKEWPSEKDVGHFDNSQNQGMVWVPFDQGTVLIPGLTTLTVRLVVKIIDSHGNVTEERTSPESEPIPIVELNLQPLTFRSPLSTCMQTVILDHMEPGASVTLSQNGVNIGTRPMAVKPLDTIQISHPPTTDPIVATQHVTLRGHVLSSDPISNHPLDIEKIPHTTQLPKLEVSNVRACRDWLDVGNATITAELVVENYDASNTVQNWWCTALITSGPNFHLGNMPYRSEAGSVLRIWQQFRTECEIKSLIVEVSVGQAEKPPKPVIEAPSGVCTDGGKVFVRGLVKEATVQFARWKTIGGNVTFIGDPLIASTTGDEVFNLPPEILSIPFDPNEGLTLFQSLCNLQSEYADPIPLHNPAQTSPVSDLTIYEPLYECCHCIPVRGAYPSSFLQAFYTDNEDPLCDPQPVLSDHVVLKLGNELTKHNHPFRSVKVVQKGCGDHVYRETAREILDLPTADEFQQMIPHVQPIVRPGAKLVRVEKCLPGAMVYLRVTNNAMWHIAPVEAIHSTVVFDTFPLHLTDGAQLFAIQTLCQRQSSSEGPVVRVTTGKMHLILPDYDPQVGITVLLGQHATEVIHLKATATDVDTGDQVPIELVLSRDVGGTVVEKEYSSGGGRGEFEIDMRVFFDENHWGKVSIGGIARSEQIGAYDEVPFDLEVVYIDGRVHPVGH